MIISARSTRPERVGVSIRSVDVSRFPDISVIIDARDSANEFYPSLKKADLTLYQDNRPVVITSLEKTSTANNIPVDIVFVIDQTGSMRQEVNEVKNNIAEFTQRLTSRGVDCRLGLISFSDRVERRIELEEDVNRFISWIDRLTIGGGGDDNENALEGLSVAGTLKFRKTAQRIVILITDAMFHQKGDQGDGRTDFTTKTMGEFLVRNNIRLFAITPETIPEYKHLAELTRGRAFNIVDDFSSILDDFSASITNLYAVHYRMGVEVPPEAIDLEIRNYQDEVVLNERVPVLEVDKKFIIDNILFDFNKASFDQSFVPELRTALAMLREYTAMHVEIRGHTDYIGSDEYNIALSDARARSVKQFLVQRGIADDRITTRGMGKTQPIAPNDTELGRRLNRRTEIVITQK
jgi:outer membrane protein OmpA-like peptidoglycan-associated protein/Mg-chelatase subunit ChlD